VTRTFGHDDEGPPAGRLSGLPQDPRKLRLAPAIFESASNQPREIQGYLMKRINYFAIETTALRGLVNILFRILIFPSSLFISLSATIYLFIILLRLARPGGPGVKNY